MRLGEDKQHPNRRHLRSASHSTLPDHTTLPAQHFRSSGLLCRRSDGLELATGQSLRPGAHQQQLQTIAENEPISSLPLSTHSAVEMLHDSALYKSIIDSDIDNIAGRRTYCSKESTFDIDVYVECVGVAVVEVDHVWQHVAGYRVMSKILLANDISKQSRTTQPPRNTPPGRLPPV